jgi:hypothetical protein
VMVGSGRLLHQRLQSLFGGGILEVVQAVQIQGRLNGANVACARVTRALSTFSRIFGTTSAPSTARMTTTTMISMRVKPLYPIAHDDLENSANDTKIGDGDAS